MRKLVVAFAAFAALFLPHAAFAQADTISTPCPTSFTCAFSAAETLPLNNPSTPGQPDVYVGYLSFGPTGAVTMTIAGNQGGALLSPTTYQGTCTPGSNGSPATIDLTSGPELMFVTEGSGQELRFFLSKDSSGSTKPGTSISVRIGDCRAL